MTRRYVHTGRCLGREDGGGKQVGDRAQRSRVDMFSSFSQKCLKCCLPRVEADDRRRTTLRREDGHICFAGLRILVSTDVHPLGPLLLSLQPRPSPSPLPAILAAFHRGTLICISCCKTFSSGPNLGHSLTTPRISGRRGEDREDDWVKRR